MTNDLTQTDIFQMKTVSIRSLSIAILVIATLNECAFWYAYYDLELFTETEFTHHRFRYPTIFDRLVGGILVPHFLLLLTTNLILQSESLLHYLHLVFSVVVILESLLCCRFFDFLSKKFKVVRQHEVVSPLKRKSVVLSRLLWAVSVTVFVNAAAFWYGLNYFKPLPEQTFPRAISVLDVLPSVILSPYMLSLGDFKNPFMGPSEHKLCFEGYRNFLQSPYMAAAIIIYVESIALYFASINLLLRWRKRLVPVDPKPVVPTDIS